MTKKVYLPSILDMLNAKNKTEQEYLQQLALESAIVLEADETDESLDFDIDDFDKALQTAIDKLYDTKNKAGETNNSEDGKTIENTEQADLDLPEDAAQDIDVQDGLKIDSEEQESGEDQVEKELNEIKTDLERIKTLDRLKFLITAIPKLELIVMAVPGRVAEKEPLILVYILDKISEIKYLVSYLIANVNRYKTETLEKIITELETYIDELVEALMSTVKRIRK